MAATVVVVRSVRASFRERFGARPLHVCMWCSPPVDLLNPFSSSFFTFRPTKRPFKKQVKSSYIFYVAVFFDSAGPINITSPHIHGRPIESHKVPVSMWVRVSSLIQLFFFQKCTILYTHSVSLCTVPGYTAGGHCHCQRVYGCTHNQSLVSYITINNGIYIYDCRRAK